MLFQKIQTIAFFVQTSIWLDYFNAYIFLDLKNLSNLKKYFSLCTHDTTYNNLEGNLLLLTKKL